MANLLTIIKDPNDYFTFILNDDTVNSIKNTRNDLTTVGQFCHFKTSNGANLIQEQNILFSNVTIINGGSTLVPVSIDDLFVKLISVGFFDWINGTGGGVNRFDELEDTFQYFGKDGQVVRVNESELKLETFVMPDVSYLNKFPNPLVAGRILKVNETATAYEFANAFNTVTQEIREGETETSPSEDAVFLALQTIAGNTAQVPKIQFTSDGIQDTYDIGINATIKAVFREGALLDDSDWVQNGSEFTLTFVPEINERIKPI